MIETKNIFVVVQEDRHADPHVEAFSTAQAAIRRAKALAEEHNSHPEHLEEEEVDGWVYYCQYSCEGDCVSVREIGLDGG